MGQVEYTPREASRIADVLGQLDALHRFEERLGVLAPYWAKFLAPVQDALETCLVDLIATHRKEPTTMPVTVAPYSLKILSVAGYGLDNPEIAAIYNGYLDRPGEGPDVSTAFEAILSLPEPMAPNSFSN